MKLMAKKSQLSLFLVFGIVMLIAAGFIAYLSSAQPKAEAYRENEIISTGNIPSAIYPVKLNIDICMQNAVEEAILYTGLSGGYYKVPEPKISYFWDELPLYVINSQNKMPSKETIENEISQYIIGKLPQCIGELKFDDLKIEAGAISANTVIGKEKVIANAHYPLTILRYGSETKLTDFRTEVPVRLDAIYNMAENITNEQIANNGALCADCLIDMANENEVKIDVSIHEGSLIFTIFDNNSIIGSSEFIYGFAVD